MTPSLFEVLKTRLVSLLDAALLGEVARLREENEHLRKDLKEEREDAVAYLHHIAKQGKDGAHTLNFQFAANTIKVGEHRSNKALPLW